MDYGALFQANADAVFRVRFKDGEVFLLHLIRDSSDGAGEPDTWTGFIVAREGLSERRQKFFRVGNGLDFRLGDIESVEIVPKP